MRENSYWYYKGEQSKEKEKITIRGVEHDDYWYLVDIGNCAVGWVYGGAVEFVDKPDRPNIDAIFYFSPSLLEALGESTAKNTTDFVAAFDNIKIAKDLLAFYATKEKVLYDIWEADILSQYATDLSCVIPFLEYTLLCSECGEQFYFKHEAFLNKAKTTNDKIDDLIFQLLLDAVGDYNSWDVPSINQHDCDLCWHSNLGNGITLKLFKQLNEIWALYDNLTGEKPAIMPIMERMENYLFYTMTTGTYMNTQKKVLGEYEKIAAIFQGRAIDKSRFTDFSKLKNDLISGSGFTFDCANKDCATMVMKEAFPDN